MNESITILDNELHKARIDLDGARERVSRLEKAVDLITMTTKPTYPTSEQISGLLLALKAVEENKIPKSHHGDPVKIGSPVAVDGKRGFIKISHNAPFSKSQRGHKLWAFSDSDIKFFIDTIEDWSHKVYDFWTHDTGVSFILKEESVRK